MSSESERKDMLVYHLDLYRVDIMALTPNLIKAIESYAQRRADKQCFIQPKEHEKLKKSLSKKSEIIKQKSVVIKKLKAELDELGGYHVSAKIIYPNK